MKFRLPLLDELAMNHKQVLVFDCEFWHILNKEGDDNLFLQPNTDFFFIPYINYTLKNFQKRI